MRAPALLLLTAAIAWAQFKSTVALVIALTTVTDSKGKYIDIGCPTNLRTFSSFVETPCWAS